MRRSKLTWVVVACALSMSALAAEDASACGASMEAAFVPSAEAIAEAERLAMRGQYFTAAILVHHEFPTMKSWSREWAMSGLEARAERVMALAVTRMDGALTLGTPWRGWTAWHRNEQLEWAVGALEQLDREENDPRLESYLGEAMAKIPKRRADALMLLERLATNDVLVTPQAYVALAKLRDARGDAAGRDDAKSRCVSMTSRVLRSEAAATCRIPIAS